MTRARRMARRVSLPLLTAIAGMAAIALPSTAQTVTSPRAGAAAGLRSPSSAATAVGTAAQAASFAPPRPGTTPAAAFEVHVGDVFDFYTGTDGHMYTFGPTGAPGQATSLGGQLIGGPGATDVPPGALGSGGAAQFGQGTDRALWMAVAGPKFVSLGGHLTSRPGAAAGALAVPGGESIDAVVRGADGAVWDKELISSSSGALTPRPWVRLGGHVLAGTGPAAVNAGGTLFVVATGTDRRVWLSQSTDGVHFSGWRSLGGRSAADVGAATPAAGVGVAFVRGSDGAAWFNEFAGTTAGVTAGWHTLHGRLTSGVGAAGASALNGMTWAVVLGGDGHIWQASGVWPAVHGWTRIL
jgi:hypothetical protein